MVNLDSVTAGTLPNGRLQLWGIDTQHRIWSCWQRSGSKDPTQTTELWSAWTMAWNVNALESVDSLAAASLPDGRIELWAITKNDHQLWTCWQNSPSNEPASWHSWRNWDAEIGAMAMTVAPLNHFGMLQFWFINGYGKIVTCNKETPSSNAIWTSWRDFELQKFGIETLTAAGWSDGSCQLWAVVGGKIWSCGKPDSGLDLHWLDWSEWLPWQDQEHPPVMLSATSHTKMRMELWAVDTAGVLWRAAWDVLGAPSFTWLPTYLKWQPVTGPPGPGVLKLALLSGPIRQRGYRVWTTIKPPGGPLRWMQSLTSKPTDWALFLATQPQERDYWCWAAVAATVSHFYDFSSPWTQCKLANAMLKRTDCCTSSSLKACNKGFALGETLTKTGNLASVQKGPLLLGKVQEQIKDDRPIGAHILWKSGKAAHVVLISGVSSKGMLTVEDPWYGQSLINYEKFKSSYHPGANWDWSYLTQASATST